MTLHFIPTIDVKGRHCVRLRSGNFDKVFVKLDIIRETEGLVRSGIKRVHIVDLEGSLGRPNLRVVKAISNFAGRNAQIQVGGGLRSLRMIAAYFEVGVTIVVLGTIALTNPKLMLEATMSFRRGIGVGLDGNMGHIVTHGWKQCSRLKVNEYLELTRCFGVGVTLCTSVQSDGGLSGLNLTDIAFVLPNLTTPFVVSGGLSSAEELKLVSEVIGCLAGILCGSAVYRKLIGTKAAAEGTSLSCYRHEHKSHSLP